jgi:hypothetical protein
MNELQGMWKRAAMAYFGVIQDYTWGVNDITKRPCRITVVPLFQNRTEHQEQFEISRLMVWKCSSSVMCCFVSFIKSTDVVAVVRRYQVALSIGPYRAGSIR